jgi:predicted phosphoribosyltransferase
MPRFRDRREAGRRLAEPLREKEPLDRMEPTDRAFEAFQRVIAEKRAEVEERVERYRGGRPRVELRGKSAIVVDDGIATGYTFAAALAIARRQEPSRLVAAAPVASSEGGSLVSDYCDELVALGISDPGLFFAVSLYYDDFPQVSDDDVVELLRSDR